MEPTKSDDAGRQVELTMIGDGRCRVSYGIERGRFVLIAYDDARPYILGERDRADLIKLYDLAD